MVSVRFAALVAATGVLAKTPAGFTPASQTDLIVDFSGVSALNGVVVSKGSKWTGSRRPFNLPQLLTTPQQPTPSPASAPPPNSTAPRTPS